ncbi:hypothetical protein SAMN05443667_11919 [Flavobacterium gillisiae]|jgi:hypothetical protein|uniref:Uncharacterized protein n=1 Tax=Flavobacterium gillisiae TaxID=150146 RepID=A0A1H4GAR3_9FLAO|nr:hypothetical protein [Flavobacterium gillisiae]SEB06527.1 hypothetical protein SAMN05443667_11919 [Flavobacterium gillisiae]
MIKITEKNRSIVFLAGTILIGILLIGAVMYIEYDDVEDIEIVNEPPSTTFPILEKKIANLKQQNFNPTSYSTLATEIDASYQQGLINSSAKTNLITNLTSVYSGLVYNQCGFFLAGTNANSSTDVLNWLAQLERISAKNVKIDNYRNQIKWYQYYSLSLPTKVNNFIRPGITNYDEATYKVLKTEVQQMPNLKPEYKNKAKFSKIRTELTAKLERFNTQFYTSE